MSPQPFNEPGFQKHQGIELSSPTATPSRIAASGTGSVFQLLVQKPCTLYARPTVLSRHGEYQTFASTYPI